MSLIQIPKIEYITLEQFIPNWTEMIEEMDEKNLPSGIDGVILDESHPRVEYAQSQGLDYGTPKSCLVGEANHHSDDYKYNSSCNICSNLCTYHHAGQALRLGHKTFQSFKLDLFTHMLEAHTQLMIK